VQVLQAANTGITSLQSLIASAQSIATQALQSTVGYSTLSHVSTTIPGATSSNLLGTTSYNSATASSNVLYSGTAGARRQRRRARRSAAARLPRPVRP